MVNRNGLRAFLALSGVASLAGACSDDADSGDRNLGGATVTGGSAGGVGKGGGSGSGGSGGTAGSKAGAGAAGAATGGSAAGGKGGAGSGGTGGSGKGSAGVGGSGAGSSGTTSAGNTGQAGSSAGTPSGGSAGESGGGDGDAGWLYTEGNKVYVADGDGGGTPWVGRGVNMDDLFLCGYNYTLWMESPDDTLNTIVDTLVRDWKPTFLRIGMSMSSFETKVSWLSDEAKYKTPMTNVIENIGTHPGVYVLVTVRTDQSMTGPDEATQLPTDSTTTPNAGNFPRGTDDVYEALVESFGSSKHVVFGISNEPGGNAFSNEKIRGAMDHAITTIRAKEDELGVPHHLIAVQGNGWTSDISTYGENPLEQENIIYEVHGYPPPASGYTYDNIPVFIGEYGALDSGNASAFYADLESKQIPNLAWYLGPYSDCAPDLVQVDQSPSNLTPNAYGTIVKDYLLDHAD